MSTAHALADAIVTALAGFASETVTIRRCRLVTTDLATIDGTVVSVVPYSVTRKHDCPGVVDQDYEIRIVVQKKLTGTSAELDAAEEDTAATLTENIAEFLVGDTRLFCECSTAELSPSYEAGYLSQMGLFDATIKTLWGTFRDGD
jgi:hypothetical protein